MNKSVFHNRILKSFILKMYRRIREIALVLLLSLAVGSGSGVSNAQFNFMDKFIPDSSGTGQSEMLLQADVLEFDQDQDLVSAIGNVVVHYENYELTADILRLNRQTSRLVAEGNIELISHDGTVIKAEKLDISEDFKDGLVNSLQVETVQRTVIHSEKATRENENVMAFENATYSTYYNLPVDIPSLWRLRAVRIIQDRNVELIIFEDARLELFGLPIFYLPKFAISDPQTPRSSGFLRPNYFVDTNYGYGFIAPYHYSIAPSYDTSLTTTFMTKQGFLLDWEWRQLLENTDYSLGASGIWQTNPDMFETKGGMQEFRGAIKTEGETKVADFWRLGWNYSLLSDRTYPNDYSVASVGHYGHDPRLFLRGNFKRNYFDANIHKLRVAKEAYTGNYKVAADVPSQHKRIDPQGFQPLIHPVIDHEYHFDRKFYGGEFSLTSNLTSLTRNLTDVYVIDKDYYYLGYSGSHTRFSMKGEWQRKLIDRYGQVYTPFIYSQIDLFTHSQLENDHLDISDSGNSIRVTPAVGVEYQYPFVSPHIWGTQTISPIGQVIVRPSEHGIGETPNNDSLIPVFESSNLFEYDKFTGFDRAEGGTRLNFGIRHLLQFQNGTTFNTTLGQSVNVAGKNSFAVPDRANPFMVTSLEDQASDVIATSYLDTNFGIQVGSDFEFDKENLALNRIETQTVGSLGPVSGSAKYSFFRDKPEFDIGFNRQVGQASLGLKISDYFRGFGSIRYDLERDNVLNNSYGLAYDDDGISISFNYGTINDRITGERVDTIMKFNIHPRTLGNIGVDQLSALGLFDEDFFN